MSRRCVLSDVLAERAFGLARPPRVHIYSVAMDASPNTHGAGLAICSQVQAFLDLGCEVEFVFIRTRENVPSPAAYFIDVVCTVVDARKERPSRFARVAYWAGRPRKLSWQQLYPARDVLLREVKARIESDGESIHVFQYLRTANIIPFLPKALTIWACNEIESEFIERNFAVDQEREGRPAHGWESRKLRRVSDVERRVARASGLVLCVASEDAPRIVDEWSVPHAAYLPLSIANGDTRIVSNECRAAGELRLLHIGALSHLPTYTSLEFLLTRVFPLLDADLISRLKLEIVGSLEADEARNRAIMEMARPYPNVLFSGFVDDIRAAYRRSDLQVVASTQASGVRTRIIESWAFGMPVLSTTVGAGGVKDIEPDRNILVADDAAGFARILQQLIQAPKRLDEIAAAARQTYEEKYGRRAVAAALGRLLNTYFDLRLPSVAALEAADDSIPS